MIQLWFTSRPLENEKFMSEDRLTYTSTSTLVSRPPLEHWSLILGEVVHNLRGALDALAWELCTWEDAVPPKPKRVSFPVCTTKKDWDEQISGPLSTMPKIALERLEMIQPFNFRNPTNVLSILNELSNQDKHRVAISFDSEAADIEMMNCMIKYEDEASASIPAEIFVQTGPRPQRRNCCSS